MKQGCRVTGALLFPAALLAGVIGCTPAMPVNQAPPAAPAAAISGVAMKVGMPSEIAPMTLDAVLAQPTAAPGETVAVMVGVRLLPGWHTYAVVPPEEPYVQTRMTLDPEAGVTASGDWIAPPPLADAMNPQLKIYESTPEPMMFMHSLKVADNASGDVKVRVTVLFQTCDMSRCLPPEERIFDLKLKVVAAGRKIGGQ